MAGVPKGTFETWLMSRKAPPRHRRCPERHLGGVERLERHLRDMADVSKGTFGAPASRAAAIGPAATTHLKAVPPTGWLRALRARSPRSGRDPCPGAATLPGPRASGAY